MRIAAVPIPEPPAWTSTLSPGSSRALSNSMCCTVPKAIPAQAASVSLTPSGTFTASGANNSFEATVIWRVLDGTQVVAEGFSTAEGWGEDKLFAWEAEVDVSGLAPGTYTFVASNDDPSGGTEGAGPHEDSKTITVE